MTAKEQVILEALGDDPLRSGRWVGGWDREVKTQDSGRDQGPRVRACLSNHHSRDLPTFVSLSLIPHVWGMLTKRVPQNDRTNKTRAKRVSGAVTL